MGPAWFVVQLLLFSRGGPLGVVPLMKMVTTMTTTMMTIAMAVQTYLWVQSGWVSLLEWQLLAFVSQQEFLLFLSPWPCQQIRGSMETPTSILSSQDKMVSSSSLHSKQEWFGHRTDLPPVNSPVNSHEHSLSKANSSKEMLSNVNCPDSDVDCHRAAPTPHLLESYHNKFLRKQALSQKTRKDSYNCKEWNDTEDGKIQKR